MPRMFDTINDRVGYDTVGGLPLLSFTRVDPQGRAVRDQARARPRARARAADRASRRCSLLAAIAVRLSSQRARCCSASAASAATARRSTSTSSARCAEPGQAAPTDDEAEPLEFLLGRRHRARAASRATDRRTAGRALPAPHLARRAAAAVQRAARRHEPRRPAPGAARVRRAVPPGHRPLRRPPPRASRASPAGRRSTACAARPRWPSASSGTTTTSPTGRSGWT